MTQVHCARQTDKTSQQNQRFVKVTKTLLVLSLVFIICWLPFIIMCGADPEHDRFRAFVHRMGHDIAEILSCINPIFYFFRIDAFRKVFRRRFQNELPTTSQIQ